MWRQGTGSARETWSGPDCQEDVLVCAVKSPPQSLTSRLDDYELSAVVPFDASWLSKYSAKTYNIDFDQASLDARGIVARRMQRRYPPAHGRRVLSSVRSMTFKLLLLPVWVVKITNPAQTEIRWALVNGQTGTVVLGNAQKYQPRKR
jgi:hypothetical protein